MTSFPAFLVAMGIIVTLGDAGCYSVRQIPGKPYKGCMQNGKLYPFGHIERTDDCYSCTCSPAKMECCSLFQTPVASDRKKCKVTANKKCCNYDLLEKNDPSEECFVYSRVG